MEEQVPARLQRGPLRMEEALRYGAQVADALDKRTARNLELMVKLLEPIMLLVMAAVVGTIAVALLMPVFKLSTTLN